MGIRFKCPETPNAVKERVAAIGRSKKTVSQTNTIMTEEGETAEHVVQSMSAVDPETLTHVEYESYVTRHEVHLGTL